MATLQSFVDRIENLDAEQKGIGTDKRDVFDEADAAGFDKKAIRRLLRDRREAAKDKGTAALAEQYKMLLSEPGATYRSVAEKTGAKRSTIHRLVPKNEQWDSETGEFTETAGGTPLGEGAGTTDKPDGPGSALATNPDADRLRAQIPHSTDPEWLEREAERVEAQAAYFCRECENTGRIIYDDGQKIHGSEECLSCRRVVCGEPAP